MINSKDFGVASEVSMAKTAYKCPVCSVPLNPGHVRTTTIDRCPQCGGIWFDEGELASLLSIIEMYNNIQLEEEDIPVSNKSNISNYTRNCPKCRSAVMETGQLSNIVIDQCPKCNGYWLDKGEISGLRLLENHIRANLNLYLRLGK